VVGRTRDQGGMMTTTTRKTDPIKKITTKAGETRYRFVVDMGKRPDGGRDQRCFTYTKLGEARAARAKIIADRDNGTLVKRSKTTVAEAITTWLGGRRNLRPSAQRSYADSLRLVSDRLGSIQLQNLTKAHLDDLVTGLLKHGRRVGNIQRTGLSPRSVNLMLTLLSSVLDDAMKQGTLSRNVAKLVERPSQPRKDKATWTEGQAAVFLTAVADDRLSVAWQLSLYGLRRGEVLGLRWSDVDLDAKTITIRWARLEITGVGIVEGEPKTERGKRTLPLDDALAASLRSLRARQNRERLENGDVYSKGCEVCGGAHVVVNELGEPYRPEYYSDRFRNLAKAAGLPVIRLHDARHTCGTLMHLRGVPTAVISKWLGHASASFTMATYVHSQNDALVAAGAMYATAIRASQSGM
jgi:integrase